MIIIHLKNLELDESFANATLGGSRLWGTFVQLGSTDDFLRAITELEALCASFPSLNAFSYRYVARVFVVLLFYLNVFDCFIIILFKKKSNFFFIVLSILIWLNL